MIRALVLTLSLFGWVSAAIASSCPLPIKDQHLTATGKIFEASIETSPARITVADPFSVLLTVCHMGGQAYEGKVKVDAHMPLHNHGMNYRPSVSSLGQGKFHLEGFVFHMPGRWQFTIGLRDGDNLDRLVLDYDLK